MHMEHKHGSTNQLAAALFQWLQDEHTGALGPKTRVNYNQIYLMFVSDVVDAEALHVALVWVWDNVPGERGGGGRGVTHLTFGVLNMVLKVQ